MIKNYDNTGSYFLTIFNATLTSIQDNEIFQSIQFALTLLSTLLVIAFTAYKFYHKVKEDGRITSDEIEEAFELGQEAIEQVEEVIKKGEKENVDKD